MAGGAINLGLTDEGAAAFLFLLSKQTGEFYLRLVGVVFRARCTRSDDVLSLYRCPCIFGIAERSIAGRPIDGGVSAGDRAASGPMPECRPIVGQTLCVPFAFIAPGWRTRSGHCCPPREPEP